LSSKLAIEALYGAMHIHLVGLCQGRVFPDLAPADAAYPLIVYGFESGGETDVRRREGSSLTLVVKCVAEELDHAFINARLIRDALRDAGEQEGDALPHDSEWCITTVSQGLLVHMVEVWKDGHAFYHTGHQYSFTLELRA
jgi:hypothetical protein